MDHSNKVNCHLANVARYGAADVGGHHQLVVRDESKSLVPFLTYLVTTLLNNEKIIPTDDNEWDLMCANIQQARKMPNTFVLKNLFHKLSDEGDNESMVCGAHWSVAIYLPLSKSASSFVEKRLEKVFTLYSTKCCSHVEQVIAGWMLTGADIHLDQLLTLTESKTSARVHVLLPEVMYNVVYSIDIKDGSKVKTIRRRCENYMRRVFVFDQFAACGDFQSTCREEDELKRILFYSNATSDRLSLTINLPIYLAMTSRTAAGLLHDPRELAFFSRNFSFYMNIREDILTRSSEVTQTTVNMIKKKLRYVGADQLKHIVCDLLSYLNDPEFFPLATEGDLRKFICTNDDIRKEIDEKFSLERLLPQLLNYSVHCVCGEQVDNDDGIRREHTACANRGKTYALCVGPARFSTRSKMAFSSKYPQTNKLHQQPRVFGMRYYDVYNKLNNYFFANDSVLKRDLSFINSYHSVYAYVIYGATDRLAIAEEQRRVPIAQFVFSTEQVTPVPVLKTKRTVRQREEMSLLLYVNGVPRSLFDELFSNQFVMARFLRLCAKHGGVAKTVAFPPDILVEVEGEALAKQVEDRLLASADELLRINADMNRLFLMEEKYGAHYFVSVDEHVTCHFNIFNFIVDLDLSLKAEKAKDIASFEKSLIMVNFHAFNVQRLICCVTGLDRSECPFYVYKSACEKHRASANNDEQQEELTFYDTWEDDAWDDCHQEEELERESLILNGSDVDTNVTINEFGFENNTGDVSDAELIVMAKNEDARKVLRDSCTCTEKRGFRIVVVMPTGYVIENPATVDSLLNFAEMMTMTLPDMTRIVNVCGGKSQVFDRNIYKELRSHRLTMTAKTHDGKKRLLPLILFGSGNRSLEEVEFLKATCTPRLMHMSCDPEKRVNWVIGGVHDPTQIFVQNTPCYLRCPKDDDDERRLMYRILRGGGQEKEDDETTPSHDIAWLENHMTSTILPNVDALFNLKNASYFTESYLEYDYSDGASHVVVFRLRHRNSYSYDWPCVAEEGVHSSTKRGCRYIMRCRVYPAGTISIAMNAHCFSTKCNSNKGRGIYHTTI